LTKGVVRWLLAALVSPVVGFWVCNLLPLGDAGQSNAGLGYIVVGIENLALFTMNVDEVNGAGRGWRWPIFATRPSGWWSRPSCSFSWDCDPIRSSRD
jgi:hypothetical protein